MNWYELEQIIGALWTALYASDSDRLAVHFNLLDAVGNLIGFGELMEGFVG